MSNVFEWLSQYDEAETATFFRDKEYLGFSDYYTEYSNEYDPGLWTEYLMQLSPTEIDERSKVLDLGCGTGLMMLDFIGEDAFTVGVDLSEEMLENAKYVIEDCFSDEEYIPYVLIRKDIADFCISVKFDLIYSMGDTLNYLSEKNLERTFCNVRKMLKDDAAFIFDVIDPDYFTENVPDIEEITLEDKTKLIFNRLLERGDEGLVLNTHVLIKDPMNEDDEEEYHHQKIYSYEKICELADRTGFDCRRVPFLGDETLKEKLQVVMTVK